MIAAGTIVGVACGSVADTTTCTLQGGCGPATTSTGTQDSGSNGDAPPQDAGCNPGDTTKIDCNDCLCGVDRTWTCTHHDCPDSGPPPSKCPDKPQPGASCSGDTHCIYTDPCSMGCDCVAGAWLCGACPG